MFDQFWILSDVVGFVVCVPRQTLLCAFCTAEILHRLVPLESPLNIFMKLLSSSHFLAIHRKQLI